MVAFARAKAKSIFSKLRLNILSEVNTENIETKKDQDLSIQKDRDSKSFFEAIKSGGIWLS